MRMMEPTVMDALRVTAGIVTAFSLQKELRGRWWDCLSGLRWVARSPRVPISSRPKIWRRFSFTMMLCTCTEAQDVQVGANFATTRHVGPPEPHLRVGLLKRQVRERRLARDRLPRRSPRRNSLQWRHAVCESAATGRVGTDIYNVCSLRGAGCPPGSTGLTGQRNSLFPATTEAQAKINACCCEITTCVAWRPPQQQSERKRRCTQV